MAPVSRRTTYFWVFVPSPLVVAGEKRTRYARSALPSWLRSTFSSYSAFDRNAATLLSAGVMSPSTLRTSVVLPAPALKA